MGERVKHAKMESVFEDNHRERARGRECESVRESERGRECERVRERESV